MPKLPKKFGSIYNTGMSLSKITEEDIASIASQNLEWDSFIDASVLISGANGFLPAYIVETLLHLNDTRNTNITVLALVRNKEKALKRFEHHAGRPDLQFLVQDVSDPITIDAKVDFIIHAASQATPKVYGVDPVGTMLPNIIGTNNLLKLGKEKSVKGFLFFSSGEVYGGVPEDSFPTKESYKGHIDPVDVRSCYGESKRAGETLCVSWCHQFGVPIKIVRLFHTYGPGMDLEDGRVFADFVADILHDRDIVMRSDGKQTRAFCYIADAISGIFTVLLQGKNGEAYNVGWDKETSIVDLAHMLVGLFPEKKLEVSMQVANTSPGYVGNKISRTCPDISKMKALGWEPKIEVRDGFRRTIVSYTNDSRN